VANRLDAIYAGHGVPQRAVGLHGNKELCRDNCVVVCSDDAGDDLG